MVQVFKAPATSSDRPKVDLADDGHRMPIGTDLFRSMLAFNYGDGERGQLQRKVWSPTPWMIDVYVGRWEDGRERQILEWCYETFGSESSPIHERIGRWHRGGATVNGWTWFGFASEDDMREFEAAWPLQTDVAGADFTARRCARFAAAEGGIDV